MKRAGGQRSEVGDQRSEIRGQKSEVILLKKLSVPKMNPEKHHQNTFTENKNRLYAILERNFSPDFHVSTRTFQNRGVLQQNQRSEVGRSDMGIVGSRSAVQTTAF